MSEKHLTHELNNPHPDITMSLRIIIDQTLHDFNKQERAFWALMYAKSVYGKIDDPDHDWVDYQIAVDETINSTKNSEMQNPSSIGEQ